MFTDYITRPFSIPNLPFVPSSLADTMLSYVSSVCGPCSGGSLKRAVRPQAEGLQTPPSSTQQSCLHIPTPPPALPGGPQACSPGRETRSVVQPPHHCPVILTSSVGRERRSSVWEPHRGAPANVSARGSQRRGRCRETPVPTCAPGPQHAPVLAPRVRMGWRGVWIVSSPPSNHRYPGTGEHSQATWYLGRWSHNLGP